MQLAFVGGAHLREREGVLVIFLLDGSGDSCRYYVLHLISPLYCGVHTTETISDQLCVAFELAHLVHPFFPLLGKYDCVGVLWSSGGLLFHLITVLSLNVLLRYSSRR